MACFGVSIRFFFGTLSFAQYRDSKQQKANRLLHTIISFHLKMDDITQHSSFYINALILQLKK